MEIKRINNLTKEEAASLAYKIGFESEANRTNCAQSTFHAVMSVLGYKNPLIFKSLSAFEGGSAVTTYGNCGAFSGALAAFGFFFGRTYKQWEKCEPYIKSSILGQKLYKKFKEKYGTIICGDIHIKIFGMAFRFMDEENLGINKKELKAFEEAGGHLTKCPDVVGLSSAWAAELLWDKLAGDKDISGITSFNSGK